MNKNDVRFAERLLQLKDKARRGCQWTHDEHDLVKLGIESEGEIAVLTACCVLESSYANRYEAAFEVLLRAIESNNPSPYAELCIYETAVSIETSRFEANRDSLILFIERSLSKRAVDLTNTICLLGELARIGEKRALSLLKSLASDSDPQIRDNVAFLLQSFSRE